MLFITLNVLFPVMLGAAYYLFVSPKVNFVRFIKQTLGIRLPAAEIPEGFPLRDFVIKHGADALWAYALVFALFLASGREKRNLPKVAAAAVAFSAMLEVLQIASAVPGVFDVRDIITEAIAGIIAVLVIHFFYEEEDRV